VPVPSDAIAQLNTILAGRYALERELGRGGMATVYLARDRGMTATSPSRLA
jgi:hypothetical protein